MAIENPRSNNIMPLWKTLLLNLYYQASKPVRRWNARRWRAEHRVPLVVLYYHRIANDAATPWTMSNRLFQQHLHWLQDHFDMISLEEAQRRIRSGTNDRPSVSITFDDGYADNCRMAIPLLVEQGIPCTYFVASRNVLEERPFDHDRHCGHQLAPNSVEELKAMAAAGIEIGAHTHSHPNLGSITDRNVLFAEVISPGRALEAAIGHPVRRFAFPYGMYQNLNRTAFVMAAQAGFQAVCSAYGGLNFPGDDAFHIQRMPGDVPMIRLKNMVTGDPRKLGLRRFVYPSCAAIGRVEATTVENPIPDFDWQVDHRLAVGE